jgi:hypothetical protein
MNQVQHSSYSLALSCRERGVLPVWVSMEENISLRLAQGGGIRRELGRDEEP